MILFSSNSKNVSKISILVHFGHFLPKIFAKLLFRKSDSVTFFHLLFPIIIQKIKENPSAVPEKTGVYQLILPTNMCEFKGPSPRGLKLQKKIAFF